MNALDRLATDDEIMSILHEQYETISHLEWRNKAKHGLIKSMAVLLVISLAVNIYAAFS